MNSDTASKLLHPPLVAIWTSEEEQHWEEELHPWRFNRFSPFKVPFLRVWDCCSGSQPNATNCMISRAPRQRLDTFESRKKSLTIHVNHKRWTPTPYISFTTSEVAVESLAEFRLEWRKRGKQTLTVVNPNVRIKKGLPILDISAEMDHYGVQDPYGMSNQYYKYHFLCIWEVLEDEIVGHWEWEDLAANARWYEEIIMPAFKAHEERMKMKSLDDEILGLSSAMSKTSLADVSPNARQIRGESNTWSENSKYFSEHYFCDSDEEANAADAVFKHYGEYDSCSDTDDEVEEANAADDSIKRLENGF